jgi:predicted O-methyltransferase YrrM
MKSSILDPQIQELLEYLYADAAKSDQLAQQAALQPDPSQTSEQGHQTFMRTRYMAVGREFGRLLYALVRGSKATNVVEFGTSFGVSGIYLASALRDNGGGTLITTEFHAEKSETAKKNLSVAALAGLVDFRVGDARESLKRDLPKEIDLVFLDGAKGLYLEVLKIIEPNLRPGALIVSDNTDSEELIPFLEYVRKPGNGYLSSAILTSEKEHGRPHEISIRL